MNKCSSLQQNNSERSGGTSQSCKSRKTGDTGLDFLTIKPIQKQSLRTFLQKMWSQEFHKTDRKNLCRSFFKK